MIRYGPAYLKEIPALFKIYSEDTNAGHEHEVLKYREDDFVDYVDWPEKAFFIVARDGKKPVGFVLVYDMINWAYLDIICVKPSYRGKHIGSGLLDYVFSHKRRYWFCIEACFLKGDKGLKSFFKHNSFSFNKKTTVWINKSLRPF